MNSKLRRVNQNNIVKYTFKKIASYDLQFIILIDFGLTLDLFLKIAITEVISEI